MLEMEQLRAMLVELGMARAAEILEAKLTSATEAKSSYVAFSTDLLGHELASRRLRAHELRMRLAGLPYKKLISDFDFSWCPSIDRQVIDDLCSLAFVASASNVVLLGPPGTGNYVELGVMCSCNLSALLIQSF